MKLYRVKGNSMSPFLEEGDLVLVRRPRYGGCRIGAIVVFERNSGELIVHRVVGRERRGMVYVKGDRHGPRERVKVERIKGRVVGVIGSGGWVRVNRTVELYSWAVSWLDRGLGWLLRRLWAFPPIGRNF